MRGLRKGVSVKVQQREILRKLREGCPAEAKGRAHSQKEVRCRKVGAEKARQIKAFSIRNEAGNINLPLPSEQPLITPQEPKGVMPIQNNRPLRRVRTLKISYGGRNGEKAKGLRYEYSRTRNRGAGAVPAAGDTEIL